jgi:hypothetical protein
MNFKKHLSLTFIFLIIGFLAKSQDTLTFSGIPDFSFYGSTTNRMDSISRIQIENSFIKFEELQMPIIEYLEAENSGNKSLAKKILVEKLDNQNEFGLQMGFMLFRMNQMNILYLPMFQVNHPESQDDISISNRILVSCTIEQYEEVKLIREINQFKCV